jgi:hypothetical protein
MAESIETAERLFIEDFDTWGMTGYYLYSKLWRSGVSGHIGTGGAAVLGYMNFRHVAVDGLVSTEVSQRCVDAANRNDGFAQYVVAWQAYELGEHQVFASWLHKSAKQRFLPAITDVARSAVQDPRGRDIAKRSFFVAFKRGHVISALFFFKSCLNGQFGFLFRLLGLVGFPLSLLLVLPLLKLCPFSIRVFAYPMGTKKPLFT